MGRKVNGRKEESVKGGRGKRKESSRKRKVWAKRKRVPAHREKGETRQPERVKEKSSWNVVTKSLNTALWSGAQTLKITHSKERKKHTESYRIKAKGSGREDRTNRRQGPQQEGPRKKVSQPD